MYIEHRSPIRRRRNSIPSLLFLVIQIRYTLKEINIRLHTNKVQGEWKLCALKPKLVQIIFKISVRTAKKNTTLHHYTKINLLMSFKEIITVYTENHTKPINTKCRVTDC
jgi:hypothetical protein